MSYQHVVVCGRLGQDPEIKYTSNGKAVCNMSVATSDRWTDKDSGEKKEKTEWHRIVAFGRNAEIVGEYSAKGREILIDGKLQTRKWQDQSGADRYTTEIVANNITLLGNKPGGNQPVTKPEASQPATQPIEEFDDDIPF